MSFWLCGEGSLARYTVPKTNAGDRVDKGEMTKMSLLAEHEIEELFRCMKCGNCRAVCPVFQETGHEAMVARGRVRLLKAQFEGTLELTDALRDYVYNCLNCNACHVKCPCGIEVDEVILASRIAMVREGKPLPEGPQMLRERLIGESNPYGEKRGDRGAWLPEPLRAPREAPAVFHAGCAISYANNRVGKMILRLLDAAGADFMMMGSEEQCCGDPILRTGDVESARAQHDRNIDEYKKYGVETIVTPCAGCLKTFKRYYSGRPASTPPASSLQPPASRPFRVMHTLEWMAELIAEGRLTPKKELAKRVAYFDGCDIGRHSGVYEAPRAVLRAIPGVKLIEFPAHHEMSRCCGGPLMAGLPEMASSIASKRIREALSVGADMIAVACPTCLINLKEGANALGERMDIQDVTSLLHRAVK
jgi:glycolate oxidase